MSGDELCRGEHLRLVRRRGWEYAEHLQSSESVAVFATTAAGGVVLIEQWREPVGCVVLELPAGVVDPGETPAQAAVRELLEETGYEVAGAPELLLASPILAGLTSSVMHLFRVECGARIGPGGGVADERIAVQLVPLAQVEGALAAADAVDWHLPAALHLVRGRACRAARTAATEPTPRPKAG